MLKVKDNVDLNVLEKYGFKREWNYKTGDYDGLFYCKDFKICKNRHIMPFNGTNHKRYDIIYDLIQDGLIEKIEEE